MKVKNEGEGFRRGGGKAGEKQMKRKMKNEARGSARVEGGRGKSR